jgi:hypothetical protein
LELFPALEKFWLWLFKNVESGADPESVPYPLTENEPDSNDLSELEDSFSDPDSPNPDPDAGFLVNPDSDPGF